MGEARRGRRVGPRRASRRDRGTRSPRRDARRRGSTPSCCSPRCSASTARGWCSTLDAALDADAAGPLRARWSRGARRASRSRTSSAARRSGGSRWRSTARVLIPRPETELLVEVGLTLPARRAGDRRRHGQRRGRARAEGRAPGPRRARDRRERRRAGGRARERARGSASTSASCARDLLGGLTARRRAREPSVRRRGLAARAGDHPLRAGRRAVRRAGRARRDPPARRDRVRRRCRLVALEVGFDQADAVAGAAVRRGGFGTVERLRDLAGHERVVVGRR